MILENLADLLDRHLVHARVGNLERDLFHLLVADAVERKDLQRVQRRSDRSLVELRGMCGELGVLDDRRRLESRRYVGPALSRPAEQIEVVLAVPVRLALDLFWIAVVLQIVAVPNFIRG